MKRLKRNHPSSPKAKGEADADAEAVRVETQEHGFGKDASKIGLAIQDVANKASRLSKLAKGSSMFDDPAREIQKLIAVITQDIMGLNTTIQELESRHASQKRDNTSSSHFSEHCKMILIDLKGRLMQTTNDFKEVLTARTENLKLHESRKHLFMVTASGMEEGHKPKNDVLPRNSVQTPPSHAPPPWAKGPLSTQPAHSS